MRIVARALVCLLLTSVFVSPVKAADDDASWIDRVSPYANLRLRFEELREDGRPDANRDRERGRARFGFKADVHERVKIIFGLATGGDNPVSRNVTGDGGFTTKEIGLELFYVDWEVNDSLNIYGGKMKSPLFRAGRVPLIWDNDLNLEGVAAKYSSDLFFGTLTSFAVEERSGTGDSLLHAVQAGLKFKVGDTSKLTTGLGYFMYTNTIGNEPFYNGDPRGNTVDADGNLVFDYHNAEAFAQFDTKIGNWPLQLYGHFTVNNKVDREDTAYTIGGKIGAAKKKGNMQFSWDYLDIGADAVIGTFSDSDFGGGGTDARGHIFRGRYMLTDAIFFGGALFVNKVDGFQGGLYRDFTRIQLDLEFRFN